MSDLATYTRPTLIEVMTPHCAECRAMQPDLDAVANEHRDDVDLVVLDATQDPERAASLKVLGTPTLIAVKDGVEISRHTGRRTRPELSELFAAVAAGDTTGIAAVSHSDRLVWSVAGVLLAVAGLAAGPSWLLVAAGLAVACFAWIRAATA